MLLVYGGTFNPPTVAHGEIISILLDKFKPDLFYLLPVGPHYNKAGVASYADRFKMCKILADKFKVLVSDFENTDKYLGTYNTLNEFRKIDSDVYFIMGADNFDYLDKWIKADLLVKEFKFIILTRKGFDLTKILNTKFKEYIDHFTFVEYNNDISASLFRANLDKSLVYAEINDYITKNNLYKVVDENV